MGFVLTAILFILAIIGLARPYIGLLALLIVMELQPGELYPYLAPLHLERIIAAMLLIGFIAHGAKWRFPVPTKWFLAFFGAMLLSIPLAFWHSNSIASCMSFLEIVVYVLFATALLKTESQIKWFILTDVLLVDWLGGSALWNYQHGIWQYTMHIDRAIGITSSAGDPNTMASTILFAMPLSIALMTRGNPFWMKLIGIFSIAIGLVTIVDTGSRGGALGVVFLACLLLVYKPKRLIFLPVLVALSPVVWHFIPQQYKARYETVDHLKYDGSYQNRKLSWQGGIAMFESNPLTGVGAGNYADANGMKFWPGIGKKHYLNAHSLYFKTIGELGLLGVITFGGYLICVFRLNFRLRRLLAERKASPFLRGLPALLIIILLQMLFAGYASHNLYRSMWFIVGAMAASIELLPSLQGSSQTAESAEPELLGTAVSGWSVALLPALRKPSMPNQVPSTVPPKAG